MNFLLTVAFAAAIVFSGHAAASTPIEATKTCLTDSTSGKDRKLLARWIFIAVAAHPEFKSLSSASAQDREKTSREFAGLVTRLMTVDCKEQIQALVATDADISGAMKLAFSHLGEVAMQEVTTNKEVEASISQFGNFIDEDKLSTVLQKKETK